MEPRLYTTLLSFFRSSSWDLESIMHRWRQIVLTSCPVVKIDGRLLMTGDGIKISKEAKKMPCFKKLHQAAGGRAIWCSGPCRGRTYDN
jgi:hypothetical protein